MVAAMSAPRLPKLAHVLFLGLLAAVLGTLACSRLNDGKAGADPAGSHVALALDWVPEPEFGGFYAAREGGAFKRAGLDVDIQGGGPGVPVVQMVASGRADFGVVGADGLINARTRGADVIPIFATFQSSPQAIMAHASRGAKGMADVLASGTLAIDPGAPYGIFLKKKFGFDKVKVVPYDGGVARFLVEKDFAQQCYVTSEPLAAKRQGGDPQVFLISAEGYDPYTTVVITRRALWNEKPALVRAFVAAAREGWRAYLDDPTATNAVMAKLNAALDAETWKGAAQAQKPFIETDETRKGQLGMMTRARWETLGKQLAELGVIAKAPPVEEYLIVD